MKDNVWERRKTVKDLMDGVEKLRGGMRNLHQLPLCLTLCCAAVGGCWELCVCVCALCVAYVCVYGMYCESENRWGVWQIICREAGWRGPLSLLIFHSHSLTRSSQHSSRSLQHCKSLDGTWYQELKGVSQHFYIILLFASSRNGTTIKWEFCYIALIFHCW